MCSEMASAISVSTLSDEADLPVVNEAEQLLRGYPESPGALGSAEQFIAAQAAREPALVAVSSGLGLSTPRGPLGEWTSDNSARTDLQCLD